jgi:hypothetical protein
MCSLRSSAGRRPDLTQSDGATSQVEFQETVFQETVFQETVFQETVFQETVLQSVLELQLASVAQPAAAILLFGMTPTFALPTVPL